MKLENTLHNRAKFIAIHWALDVLRGGTVTIEEFNKVPCIQYVYTIGKSSHLELIPLSRITQEDIIKVAEIVKPDLKNLSKYRIVSVGRSSKEWEPNVHEDILMIEYEHFINHPEIMEWRKSDLIQIDTKDFDLVHGYWDNEEEGFLDGIADNYVNVIDFLRSRAYLLPWMNLSEDDLTGYGWVKLKEAKND